MSEFIAVQSGDVHWHVRRDARDLLLGPDGLRLTEWIATGQATVVKHGPHRIVYRVQLGDRLYFVKHYRVPDTRAMLSQWLQRSRGRREWELMRQAASHQVPTIVPVALGEQRKSHFVFENYLVTEGLENVESLYTFARQTLPTLPLGRQARMRRQLIEAVAEMAARMHEAGIQHRDLHAGNVLVQRDASDQLRPYLIDLQAARVMRRMSWRRSRTEILTLAVNFLGTASATDRLRFLRRYLEIRGAFGLDWRATAGDLHSRMWRRARTIWWARDTRCVANNRRYYFRDIGAAHGFAVSEFSESLLDRLLRGPDAPLGDPQQPRLKQSATATVATLTVPVAGLATPVVYKRYNCPKAMDPVRALFHRSPALRAWIAGHGLLHRGILTPRPLAVIECTPHALVTESYLVTEEISGASTLRSYLSDFVAGLPPDERRRLVRWLAVQVGQLVRKLHERQMSHRDMKASNLLVVPAGDGCKQPKLFLIDLDAVHTWRRLPVYRRIQNLARVYVSMSRLAGVERTDWVRFLRAYLPGGLRHDAVWKSLWAQIAERAEQKVSQNRERGRAVA